jgi:drug/metabolite transporter (DMT)-like permease
MSRSYYEGESGSEADNLLEAGQSKASGLSAKAKLRVQAVLVCTVYAIVGPSLVLVNNHILKSLNFPFPLFLSALGLITTSCVCFFIIRVLPWFQQRRDGRRHPPAQRVVPAGAGEGLPSPHLASDGGAGSELGAGHQQRKGVTLQFWLRNMVPIGAAQGLTFASTNAAYMYLTITFTQMLAAFTPTVTLVLLYLFGVETPTTKASMAVLTIGVGCALSSYGEGQFSLVGVAWRSLGIFSEAMRLVLTQHLLKNHKLSIFESQYYLAPIGASFLLVGALFNETGRAMKLDALATMAAHPMLFTASALLGVVASMLTFLVIKLTNSVTLKVINTARNAAFVLFTVMVLGEQASRLQVMGYLVSLAAFCMYMYVKVNGL